MRRPAGPVTANGAPGFACRQVFLPSTSPGSRHRRVRPWLFAGFFGGQAQAMMLGVIGFLILDRLHLRLKPDEGAAITGIVLMAGAFATLLSQWGLIPLLKMTPRTTVLYGAAFGGVGIIMTGLAQDLHAIVQSSAGEELASHTPQSKEAALDALRRLAATSATSSVGPTAVGSIKDIDSTDTLKAIAAAYLSAFTQDAKTYPYLVG